MSDITILAGRLEGYADAEDITDKERADLLSAAARLRGEAAQEGQAVADIQVRQFSAIRGRWTDWERVLPEYYERNKDKPGQIEWRFLYDRPQPAAPDGGVLTALQECRDKRQAAPAPVAGDAVRKAIEWFEASETMIRVTHGKECAEEAMAICAALAQDLASQAGAAGVDVVDVVRALRTALIRNACYASEQVGDERIVPLAVALAKVNEFISSKTESGRKADQDELAAFTHEVWRDPAALAQDLASQAGAAGVPEGWRLVPVEPTDDMKRAMCREGGGCTLGREWWEGEDEPYSQMEGDFAARIHAAMLAAAPTPAAEGRCAMADLLPCPFCGSANIDEKGWASTDSAGPACDDCGASAGGVSNTLQENIAAWNTRATQPPAVGVDVTDALRQEVEVLRRAVRTGISVIVESCSPRGNPDIDDAGEIAAALHDMRAVLPDPMPELTAALRTGGGADHV